MGFLKRVFILTLVGIAGMLYPGWSQDSYTVLAMNNIDLQNNADRVELKQIIQEIEDKHKINFAYQAGLLDNKFITLSNNQSMSLGERLYYYLNQNSLDYQKVGEKNYVIYRKKRKKDVKKGVAPYIKKNSYYYIKYNWEEKEPPIQGTVVDEEGEPLIGATVQVKEEPGKGAITDFEGKFSFDDVDADATLIVSFVGYETIEVPVDRRGELTITLAQNSELLDEVVVVGYGVQKKVDVTGAVGTLKGEDVADRKAVQVSQALQGSMPGVMVTRGNNAPGATSSIRIRGMTTIGNSNPLIIVDGVPVDNINDINPNDIEDISVLKDAASASIYGSRAAAGVILITTKRAEEGQFKLSYDVNFGVEQPTALPDYVGVQRYMEMTNELRWNDNGNNSEEYPVYPQDVVQNYRDLNNDNPNQYPITNWVDLVMNDNAPRQSHVLGISGGTKALKTNASIAYDKINGLYDGRNYDRITARINNDIKINDYLRAKIDINYKNTSSDQPTVDPMYTMLIAAPVYAAFWDDGRIASGKSGNNIYARMKYGGFDRDSYSALGGRLALDFEPVKNLVFSGVFSPNLRRDKGKYFRKQVPYYAADDPLSFQGYIEGTQTTYLSEYRNEGERYTTQFLANYNTELNKHSLGLLAGYENYYSVNESLSASRDQYTLTSFPYLDQGPLEFRDNGGGAYESAYRSFFGRVTYNYDSKYFIQANIRRDGSSRFHEDYRWGAFPSVSAGWVLSHESFLVNNPTVSFLKLRASWGTLGNERIGNYPYQATIAFSNALFHRGNEVVSELTAAQWAYAIQDITWEKTESYDLGVDINFLDDKLQLTADYFYKQTKDMLLALEIPDYIGFDNPDQNTGVMKSVGWEFQAGWQDYIGDFDYSVSFNLSDFTSTMGDLGGTEFLGDQIKIEGSEFNEWYGYKTDGLFQTQEEVENSATINANVAPGDVKYVDISGPDGEPDGTISPEYDRVLLGGSLPQLTFGGNIKLGYKDLSLRVAFQGVGKQNSRINPIMVRSLTANWGNIPAIIDGNYWSHYNSEQENLQADYPRLTRVNESANLTMSDYWLFNGGYFRVKNITLGYDLPKKLFESIGVSGISAFASASDCFTISNYPKGWDPEVSSTGYPITTQLLFGLSVNF